jgi:hypothetical protein
MILEKKLPLTPFKSSKRSSKSAMLDTGIFVMSKSARREGMNCVSVSRQNAMQSSKSQLHFFAPYEQQSIQSEGRYALVTIGSLKVFEG